MSMIKILHLSDLHFGYDENDTMKVQRENLLESLLDQVKEQGIEIIAITGDLTWKGKKEGYEQAAIWLEKLHKATNIPFDQFIVCPGNHDLNQKVCVDITYPQNATAYNSLKVENLDYLSKRFQDYTDFCTRMSFAKPTIADKKNSLVGVVNFRGVDFWVINSAWYALKGGKEDSKKLYLGAQFFDFFEKYKNENRSNFIIAMQHHPFDWLSEDEVLQYNENESLCQYIARTCDVLLTGHTHARPSEPHIEFNLLKHFAGGATYQDVDYSHNFSIYYVNTDEKTIKRYAYLSHDRSKWKICLKNEYDLKKECSQKQYVATNSGNSSEESVSVKFKNILDKLNVNQINVKENDYRNNKVILWPVVPRPIRTKIHQAQLNFMGILCRKFGWKINAIISNCGANPKSDEVVGDFIKNIDDYRQKIGISEFEISFLHKYFLESNELSGDILESFVKTSSSIDISKLKKIKEKNYIDKKKEEISVDSKVLDYILPILQIAVMKVLCSKIRETTDKKSIVIAGNDEKFQWETAFSVIGERNIGILLIPELNVENGKNANQDNKGGDIQEIIECPSKDSLRRHIRTGNVANWYFKMFLALANYEEVDRFDIFKETRPSDFFSFWTNQYEIPDVIDEEKLIETIWKVIEE